MRSRGSICIRDLVPGAWVGSWALLGASAPGVLLSKFPGGGHGSMRRVRFADRVRRAHDPGDFGRLALVEAAGKGRKNPRG